MSRLNLLIADVDEHYAGNLSSYMASNCSCVFNITCCSSEAYLKELLNTTADIDILLVCSRLYHPELSSYEIPCIIVLAEGPPEDFFGDTDAINKYQHAEKLTETITAIFSGKTKAWGGMRKAAGSTFTTAVFSPSGGTGKTSISASVGAMCGHLGMTVLYIGLEAINYIGCVSPQRGDANLSDIIYQLKNNGPNAAHKINAACSFDPASRLWFIPAPDCALDLEELTCQDLGKLFVILRETRRFELIIVELPRSFSRQSLFVMEECDELLLVSSPGYGHEEGLKSFISEIERLERRKSMGIIEKTVLVLNRSGAGSLRAMKPLYDGIISNPVFVLPELKEIEGIRKPYEFIRLPEAYTSCVKRMAARYTSREGR